MLPPDTAKPPLGKWDKVPAFCLGAAMSYPNTDVERPRIAAEWVTVLFVWDDWLEVPDSRLVDDGKGARRIQRIMMRVLTAPEGGMGVERLVLADAFRS